MVPLDLRVRVFGWVQRQLPGMNVQTMTAADIARAHDRGLGHDALLDAVLGVEEQRPLSLCLLIAWCSSVGCAPAG